MIMHDEAQNTKLYFSAYRSALIGRISDRISKSVRFEVYDNKIANCWDGRRQFCFSRCESDLQCSRDQNYSETKILRYSVAMSLLVYVVVFIWVVLFRRF